jgi:hypothetical protein
MVGTGKGGLNMGGIGSSSGPSRHVEAGRHVRRRLEKSICHKSGRVEARYELLRFMF